MPYSFIEFSNPVSTKQGAIIKSYPGQYKMPLFINNAQVYYKPGSLVSGGVGSVRNSSTKSRRI